MIIKRVVLTVVIIWTLREGILHISMVLSSWLMSGCYYLIVSCIIVYTGL